MVGWLALKAATMAFKVCPLAPVWVCQKVMLTLPLAAGAAALGLAAAVEAGPELAGAAAAAVLGLALAAAEAGDAEDGADDGADAEPPHAARSMMPAVATPSKRFIG